MIDYSRETVLITGASSGLGAEFARQLAARGATLVLLARRRGRLEDLAAELREKHGTEAHVIEFDLGEADAGPRLLAAASDLGVTSLINNAGFGDQQPFIDGDHDQLVAQLRLNVEALVSVTHAFLPQLTGILLNVASNASFQPVPFMAVYGATKAFVRSFTEALWYEHRDSGLKILALNPGSTKTEFFDVMGSTVAVGGHQQTAEQVITTALKQLDRRSPAPSVIPGFMNTVMAVSGRFVPNRVLVTTSGKLVSGQGH